MEKKKILIVDDEYDLLKILNAELHADGYEVVVAMDGLQAVGMAREQEPDLILLDIGLPAGDGFSVMERLGNLPALAFIPIVIITARGRMEDRQRAAQAGAKAFFQKPFEVDELLSTIDKILNGSCEPVTQGPEW